MEHVEDLNLERLIDSEAVSETLDCDVRTVRNLVRRRALRAFCLPGSRAYKFRPSDVLALIGASEITNEEEQG